MTLASDNAASRPTSIPADTQITLLGFSDDMTAPQRSFVSALSSVIRASGRVMDLERLAGVTVGFEFGAALQSVELGFASTRATEYTNNEERVCVGKAMRVMRDGRPMSHVVLNANAIEALADPEDDRYHQALHIVTHELGHVAELKWRDQAMPGVLLRPWAGSWMDGVLVEAATTVWEEYCACRLTAKFCDQEKQKRIYADNYADSTTSALARTEDRIKEFRRHGEVDRLIIKTGEHLLEPLRLAGYMLGHLDGMESDEDIDALCPAHLDTLYRDLLPRLRDALRQIWNTRESWGGPEIFHGVRDLIVEVFDLAGMQIDLADSRVDVPFSAETMPNGEADMEEIRLEMLLAAMRARKF